MRVVSINVLLYDIIVILTLLPSPHSTVPEVPVHDVLLATAVIVSLFLFVTVPSLVLLVRFARFHGTKFRIQESGNKEQEPTNASAAMECTQPTNASAAMGCTQAPKEENCIDSAVDTVSLASSIQQPSSGSLSRGKHNCQGIQ